MPSKNPKAVTEECTPCEEARKNNGGEKAVAYLAPVNISPAEKDSITRNKEENNSIRSPEQNQSPFETVKGLREDISKRDAFSKHYINKDGSFTTLVTSNLLINLK